MKLVQDIIIGKIIRALIEAGYRVELCDQDSSNGILWLYAMPDAGEKPEDGHKHWIQFQPANEGSDFVSDFTTSLNKLLSPVLESIVAVCGED